MSPGSNSHDPSLREAQAAVKTFHEKHGFVVDLLKSGCSTKACHLPQGYEAWLHEWWKTGVERAHMVISESGELMEAWHQLDVVKIADALGDLLYVVLGSAVAAGIDLAPIFAEIQRSNMTKTANQEAKSPLHPKGEGYEPPDLAPLLLAQHIDIVDKRVS